MLTYSSEDELIAGAMHCLEKRLEYDDILANPQDTRCYLSMKLVRELNEVFAVLFLDNVNRVLAFEKLFFGTINSVEVHPRVVAQRALVLNASSVILAHNHPSQCAEPSTADKHVTQTIKTALELFNIRVLDHIVIGNGACVSFAERGYL